ncbi:hypothetical protein B0H13DRAFT_2386921 [Mycena leptocephala]|nr:hypothetical protein B0H13DRAFT_2386921 [Mycena leptocephala]
MAPRMSKPPPPPLPFSLRAGRDAHPGKPDEKRGKRTTAEVQREKAEKATQKRAMEEKRQLASKKQLRSSCRRRWRLWRTTASLTILLRLEREKFHGHARQCLKPRMILVSRYFFVTNRDLFNLPVQVGGVVDPVSDGPGSSDDYQPPAGQDDDHDEELDPSEDDSNPAPKPVKAQKKVKGSRRLEVENVIQAKRAVLAGAVSTGNSKRKTAPTTEQAAFSSLLPDTSLTPYKVRQRSKSAGSAMSIDRENAFSDADSLPPASDYNDSSEGLGGIPSEEDDGEEQEWASALGTDKVGRQFSAGREFANVSQASRVNIHSLAGIVDTDAAGLVPLRAKSGAVKTSEINLSHLPQAIRSQFNSRFKPALFQWLEKIGAWEGFEDWNQIAHVWDKLFPDYRLASRPQLQPVVVKLAKSKLSSWQHAFATATTDSLDELLTAWELETPQQRADAVSWLLEKQPDGSRVFYYRQFYDTPVENADPDADAVVNPKGLFGGSLIIDALASHYKRAYPNGLPSSQSYEGQPKPVGPLVYSIQAAQRALIYYKSGKLIIPAQKAGEFSKTNWGDRAALRGGEMVAMNTTSDLTRHVKKLTEAQWKKIIDAAIAVAQVSRKGSKVPDSVVLDDLEPTPDVILIDNDSDYTLIDLVEHSPRRCGG